MATHPPKNEKRAVLLPTIFLLLLLLLLLLLQTCDVCKPVDDHGMVIGAGHKARAIPHPSHCPCRQARSCAPCSGAGKQQHGERAAVMVTCLVVKLQINRKKPKQGSHACTHAHVQTGTNTCMLATTRHLHL